MESVPTVQDDSSGANPSSVKSDGSSPRHDGGRGSPPPNCAICLGTCRNKSFTDSCLHQFCFKCLLTWSKVKAECPLCKQNFKSIIHNVRSNHQYEEYMVEQQQADEISARSDVDNLRTVTRRFRYSTTFTLPRHETIAIQQLLMHYPLMAGVLPPPRRRRSPASFRRTVYRHNLWARPLPDFTGRFRDSTPEFYRYNDTQMHRLVPWLNRELSYLLNDNVGHISYVMARILELLPQYGITSPEFRENMRRYFGDRTEHFLHELYCFASTPYDMTGYDRNVQYTTDSRISTMVNEVISSSESDASVDSDIVMVSSSEPAETPAGPSGLPPPAADNVIPIETISQSDTDDDSSEVMVVGYIKPPQDRTPEVVDLLGSDSDVVVHEPRAEPAPASEPEPRPAPLVKLILKRQRADRERDSDDSDDSSYRPPAARRRRRPHEPDARPRTPATPPPPAADPPPRDTPPTPPAACYSSSSSDSEDEYSDDASESDERRQKFVRRKSRKRSSREAPAPRRERRRGERRSSRSRRADKKLVQEARADRERRSKRKSHSGKGVKSSKRRESVASAEQAEASATGSAAGGAGGAGGAAGAGGAGGAAGAGGAGGAAGPSGCCRRRRSAREARRRGSREARRLKSVVKVMGGGGSVGSGGSRRSASGSEWERAARPPGPASSSDSDEDLPLNLTVQKTHPVA